MPDNRTVNGKIYNLVGQLQGEMKGIHDKLAETAQDSKDGDLKILEAIDKMEQRITNNMTLHRKYHEDNEEKWGLQTWCRNHLKQVIIVAVLLGLILAGGFGVTITKTIMWVKAVNAAVR